MADNLKVTPLHDRVIVKPNAAEEKTAGGIWFYNNPVVKWGYF